MPTTSNTYDKIDSVNPEYQEMLTTWELIDDLMGGTKAMKAAGQKWLPKEDKEKDPNYQNRLGRSVLFNGFKDAVSDLSRKPFAKPVTIQGQLGKKLAPIVESTDDDRRNITQFAHQCLKLAVKRGLVHILVDYPANDAENLAQERALGLKPLLLAIDPKRVIGWRYDVAANGEKQLTQLRIRDDVNHNRGEFAVETTERIRVIYEDRWELWAKDNKEAWLKVDQGPYTLGKIALVTIYLAKDGFMVAQCPLDDLAWLNLAHWQSMSDHRNNLRIARTGLLFFSGLTAEEVNKDIVFGLNQAFKSTSTAADGKVIEVGGKSIEAGENELRHLEEMMQAMGKTPLIIKSWGNDTAMGRAIDEGKAQCDLQAWVREIEGGIKKAFELAGEWVGEELPEDFSVDIYDDFGLTLRAAADTETLFKTRGAGDLSRETYLREIKLRGTLSETVDIDEELVRIENEGPDLGEIGREDEDD